MVNLYLKNNCRNTLINSLHFFLAGLLVILFALLPASQVYAQDPSCSLCDTSPEGTVDENEVLKNYRNPAAVYCELMGLQYESREDEHGAQYGICILPDGTECDAWDFFYGKAGQEHSYCARYGYDIETRYVNRGEYYSKCPVCVPGMQANQTVTDAVPMLELMKQNKEPFTELIAADEPVQSLSACNEVNTVGVEYVKDYLPSSFDWRTKNGRSHVGGIRDQGLCGSCYAFAACAAAEGTYNIAMGLYDEKCIDFSESFMMWCLGSLPDYKAHFYGCDGADYDYAELEALTIEGICEESQFPYKITEPDECSYWDTQRYIFNSWDRLPCNDIPDIKEAIMYYGPVDAAVWAGCEFFMYGEGVYRDSNNDCWAEPCYYTPTNHAVSLIGWNDNGNADTDGYWILRNCWGTSWGEDGYMRIGYDSAFVSCEVCRLGYAVTSVGGEVVPYKLGTSGVFTTGVEVMMILIIFLNLSIIGVYKHTNCSLRRKRWNMDMK